MAVRKIQMKRTTKDLDDVNTTSLDYGEPAYIESKDYFTTGNSTLSAIKDLKVTKLVSQDVADKGLYYSETDGKKVFTDDAGNTLTFDATIDNAGLVKHVLLNSVSIETSTWVKSDTYSDYPWISDIPIDNCTALHRPMISFSLEDANSGIFAPITESHTGGVYIYASEKPSNTITIPTVELIV